MCKVFYKEDFVDIALYNACEKSGGVLTSELFDLTKKYNISVQKLLERYKWLKEMNINPNEVQLRQNHEEIYDIFSKYSQMLNELGIEYYYTSGILAYLLVGKGLERYHHDLDVFINMNDLELLEEKCNNYGFSFKRVLGDREDGTKRIMLKMFYQDSQIPITVFMFVRERDSSITQKDYFYDENSNLWVENMYNCVEVANLSFSNVPQFYGTTLYYAITLEALYLCKQGKRTKDIYDCEVFSDKLNFEKLNELVSAMKKNKPNTVQNAKDDIFCDFILDNKPRNRKRKRNDRL